MPAKFISLFLSILIVVFCAAGCIHPPPKKLNCPADELLGMVLHVWEDQYWVVTKIDKKSLGYEGGIRKGDILVEFGEWKHNVHGVDNFLEMVSDCPYNYAKGIGEPFHVAVDQKGKTLRLVF